jgi:hypothetical protein
MDVDWDTVYELLVTDGTVGFVSMIQAILKTEVKSKEDWDTLITTLQVACQETYQKHLLKTHYTILSIFGLPELRGVDCLLFNKLRLLDAPKTIDEVSDDLFVVLSEKAKTQFMNGGSTLFFDVSLISSTRSAVLASELIQARYRETVHVLNEIDELLPTLTKEWVNVSRLWKTGNGYRVMRARETGVVIHINEYKEIRDLLATELKVRPESIAEESMRLRSEGKSEYLKFSKPLEEFVTGLIASRGIRGEFEPHFKSWIDHEGLDEF